MANQSTQNSRLQQLIIQSGHIANVDKSFLLSKLNEMSAVDRLELEQTLLAGMIPESLQKVALIRQKFLAQENPIKGNDVFSKFVRSIVPPPPKTLLSQSILLKNQISGTPSPKPFAPSKAMFNSLNDFQNLDQLGLLNPAHVTFKINDPSEQVVNDFTEKVQKLLSKTTDMLQRRGYLMSYMQSSLFNSYLNTGVTALRHPELQPRSIALNQMYQIDNRKYLNKTQFKFTSEITSAIRIMCGL